MTEARRFGKKQGLRLAAPEVVRAVLARVQHDDHGPPDSDLFGQRRLVQDGQECVPARPFKACQLFARNRSRTAIEPANDDTHTAATISIDGLFHLSVLTDGAVLRERLLTLSDNEKTFSYCLLDTPIPLLNYVAHVALHRVTDGDRTFWRWWSEFDTPRGEERRLRTLVGEDIYMRGFAAIRRHLAA